MNHHRPRRSVAAALAGLLGAALVTTTATFGGPHPAVAQDSGPTTTAPSVVPGDLELELVDQSFDVEPGDDIELTYLITGDLETVAELSPPTTTTTTTSTTTPTTTTTTTTITTTTPTTTATTDPGATATTPDAPSGEDPESAEPEPTPATTTTTSSSTTTSSTTSSTVPEPPPPDPVQLSVAVTNYAPIRSDTDLERALGPDVSIPLLTRNLDGVFIEDVRPLIDVGTGDDAGTAVMTLSVPTDRDPSEPDRLKFEESGLHPIVVELQVGDRVVASHGTIIDRRDDDLSLPPVDLALLTYIADPGPSGTLGELRAGIDALDRTADVAEALDAPLTMSIPPNIARLATESSTRNVFAETFADDEIISTPATPFDVSSAVAVDRIDAFANQLTFGEDQLKAAFPSTDVRRDAWLVTSPISAEAASELRERAVRYIVMQRDLYVATISDVLPEVDQFVEIDLGNGTTMPILLVDPLGAAFTTENTDAILDEMNATEWSIATIASLRYEQYSAPLERRDDQRSRILATPDLSAPDPRLLTELGRVAETTDAIRFAAGSELTGLTSTQRVDQELRFPETAGPSLTARLELINETLLSLGSVASMLPEDDDRYQTWQRQLAGFVSTAYADDEVTAAIEELLAEADVIRNGVIPPEPISFTLTGNEGTIDLRIGNRLDEPITVVVSLSSPRLTFPDGDQTVTLPANGFETLEVPVVARSNGTSPVVVDILTPSGQLLGEPVTLRSRVNALTGIGQVLTAGLVLVLLTWWFGNWRKRRRSDPTTIDGDEPDGPTATDTTAQPEPA